jgi:DNA (cytosine-5)-methyltransferase 1
VLDMAPPVTPPSVTPAFIGAGLFAGIGGIEFGLHRSRAAVSTELLCENWAPAQAVLAKRFDAEVAPDVRTLRSLPTNVNLVAAGFPCTDLSQAGRTAGIGGEHSGLVAHVFDLLGPRRRARRVTWLLIENVQNMLALDRGKAMGYLVGRIEEIGFRWAYRVVDSRFCGVPQRRRRVILVASPTEDPRSVLFADEAGEPGGSRYRTDAFGFYWTEGRGGLGWAPDAVPTLKGGSTVGIPSPPAIWVPDAEPGRRLVTPGIEDAEALQGFPRGWTALADDVNRRNGPRWKLVGNAVTVGVARWVGDRLAEPGEVLADDGEWDRATWPAAAWGAKGMVRTVRASEYPRLAPYKHIRDIVDCNSARTLSYRGARGFWSRLEPTKLGAFPGFREAVAEHVELTDPNGLGLAEAS